MNDLDTLLKAIKPRVAGWISTEMTNLISSGGAIGDHGALIGLSDDDHPQYVHISLDRSISAQHTFAPSTVRAPFLLNANAQGQLVTGLNADLVDSIHFSTVGSRTITVPNINGTMALGADTLSVTTTNDVSVANHTHAIQVSSNPGASSMILKTDSSGYLSLVRLALGGSTDLTRGLTVKGSGSTLRVEYDGTHYTDFSIDQFGNVSWYTNAGSLEIDVSNILPGFNFDVNLGSASRKYASLYVGDLYVSELVAQSVIATIGGRVLIGPTSILTSGLNGGATTMYTKHNSFAVNDILFMQEVGQSEWLLVTAGPTGGGPYQYTVTRNYEGDAHSHTWAENSAVFSTGTTGDGYIDLFSFTGLLSGSGPTIVGNVRTGTAYNNVSPRWAIGNLNTLYGFAVDTYGVAFGDPSGDNAVFDATALRFRVGTTTRVELTAAGVFTIKDSGGNAVITLDASLGAEITKKLTMPGASSAIAIGSTPPTSATVGTGIWLDRTGLYGLDTNVQQAYLSATDGKIYAGGGKVVLDTDGVTIDEGTANPYVPGSAVKWGSRSYIYTYLDSSDVTLQLHVSEGANGVHSKIILDTKELEVGTGNPLTSSVEMDAIYGVTVKPKLIVGTTAVQPDTGGIVAVGNISAMAGLSVGINSTQSTGVIYATGEIKIDKHIQLKDITAPGTPSSGFAYLYVNADKLYFKDDGGKVFQLNQQEYNLNIFEGYVVAGITWGSPVSNMIAAVFHDAQIDVMDFNFKLPAGWAGKTIVVDFYWATTTTQTNSVYWTAEVRKMVVGTAMPTAAYASGVIASAGTGVANVVIKATTSSFALASDHEMGIIRVYRYGSHASDTLTSDAYLIGVVVRTTN